MYVSWFLILLLFHKMPTKCVGWAWEAPACAVYPSKSILNHPKNSIPFNVSIYCLTQTIHCIWYAQQCHLISTVTQYFSLTWAACLMWKMSHVTTTTWGGKVRSYKRWFSIDETGYCETLNKTLAWCPPLSLFIYVIKPGTDLNKMAVIMEGNEFSYKVVI